MGSEGLSPESAQLSVECEPMYTRKGRARTRTLLAMAPMRSKIC